jgi:putative ABC transport system permease protein
MMFEKIPIMLKIAAKNLARNRGQSAVCIITVAVSVAAMIFLYGLQRGLSEQMIDASIKFGASHIRLVPEGFSEEPGYNKRITDPQKALHFITQEASVDTYARKIISPAMIRTKKHSRGVLMVGVDAEEQRQLGFLQSAVTPGTVMESDDPTHAPALVGEKLGRTLELSKEEKFYIITRDEEGELGSWQFKVAGFLSTGNVLTDKFQVYIPLDVAQEMLAWGTSVTQIDLLLNSRSDIDRVKMSLQQKLEAEPVEFVTWSEMSVVTHEIIQKDDLLVRLIIIILTATVGTAIGNTLLNSIYNRQGEIGTVMALGIKPSYMALMIGAESVALVIVGLLIGISLGSVSVLYLGSQGIDLSAFGEGLVPFLGEETLYPRLGSVVLLWPGIMMLIVSLIACIHPTTVAARMVPVDAMWRRRR